MRPSTPTPPHRGNRFDPPEAWLFARGVYGPPDDRHHPTLTHLTYEQVRAWGLRRPNQDGVISPY